jgi:ribonuclease J
LDLKFVALGGLGEIGKNMMAFEIRGRILLVDAGVKFPDEKTPGVDLIIPDFSYLIEQREKIVGLVLTHGHEDHVGAIPYLLQELQMPVYGTDLTLGLAEGRTKELGVPFDKHIVHPGEEIRLDPFSVEFLQVTHSVPASVSLAIKTPLGIIVHSGDFKFDQNPVDQRKMDFTRISALAKQGVLCDPDTLLPNWL